MSLNLSRFSGLKKKAVKTTLAGNPDQENNFDAQPIAPVKEEVEVSKKMKVEVKPHSFVMYTIQL